MNTKNLLILYYFCIRVSQSRQTDRQADRQTGRQTQTSEFLCRLELAIWIADLLIDLTGWMTRCRVTM